MSRRALLFASVFVCLCLPAAAQSSDPVSLTGRLVVLWGDRPASAATAPAPRYQLVLDEGKEVRLLIDESLGAARFNKKRVTVTGEWVEETFRVVTIEPTPGGTSEDAGTTVSGAQPWVTVMCKFQDLAAEPKAISYFQGMYGASFPGFDHYWREQSYGLVNVAGSNASGWYTLPHPRSYYVTDYNNDGEGDYADLETLRDDCLTAADANVNFTNFTGINLMFNADLDCCAWGGSSYLYLDGLWQEWRTTWLPPWGFNDIAVVGHEMGHGFGLPHSADAWGDPYGNRWDVMSDTWTDCFRLTNPTYGCIGQHTIGYHKDLLGWILPAKKYTAAAGEATINLEHIAQPSTNNYLLAEIPIDGTRFYTVEARQQLGYDYRAPLEGVVIHEVNPYRYEPAYVVDSDNNGDSGDAGAVWTVGETFTDAANGISVKVESAIANGYTVKLSKIIPTTTTLTSSHKIGLPTTEVTFTATVTGGGTGTVVFKNSGVVMATIPVTNGTAVWKVTLPYNLYIITAFYSGDATHAPSTSNYVSYSVGYTTVSINDTSVTEGNAGTANAVFTVTTNEPLGPKYVTYRVIDGTATGSRVGANTTFAGIPSGNPSNYPAKIQVSGSNGVIAKMTVTLNRIEHTNPADIDVLLIGPNGTGVVLMSDTGGPADVFNVVLTFDDAAAASLTTASLVAGTYKPTNLDDGGYDYFSGAPYAPIASTLSAAFNGISPNGTWSLYVVDDTGGNSGYLREGWSLSIDTVKSDYDEVTGMLTIPHGSTTGFITVPIKGDTRAEADETFTVVLLEGPYFTDNLGVGTIVNDDGPVIGPPANVTATAITPTQVGVSWTAVAQATSYRVYRSSNGTAWAQVGTSTGTSFTDTSTLANRAYLYKVHSVNDEESADSNVNLATTVVFSDSTLIRRAHFTELLAAVNAVRSLAALGGIAFTAPAPAFGMTVRRQHLLDLRAGLAAARSALALPAVTFIDDSVTAGVTPIKAVHITDLRNGVQ